MTTSWQQSRGSDLDWQYHRVEQLHRNVSLNAKKTRLILEEFESGVKDSVTELKYVSEAQFRISAPQIEEKLVEALKMQKAIQQLVEQSMMLQTTDLLSQTEFNVHSRRSSYSATPAGVYTPARTPYTGTSSIADRDPNFATYGQSPENMAPFPGNISSILNNSTHLQTPVSMSKYGNVAEDKNGESTQSLRDKFLPRCNLNFTGDNIYSPEYVTPRLGQNGTMDMPCVSNENSFESIHKKPRKVNGFDINQNQSKDSYIEIPDDIYIDSPITPGSNPVSKTAISPEFVTANNSVTSDAFLTPNQEKTNKEVVIEIDQNDIHENNQVEVITTNESVVANQELHNCSTKRKRESTCTTPVKEDEIKDRHQTSENVTVINSTPFQTKDHVNNVNLVENLASFHIESESEDKNIAPKGAIPKFSIGRVEVPHTAEYGNKHGHISSLKIPVAFKEQKDNESLKPRNDSGISKTDDSARINHHTESIQKKIEETSTMQEDILSKSAASSAVSSPTNSLPVEEIKTFPHTSPKIKDTVIICENIMPVVPGIPTAVPPLEKYTKVYVTHFEAPNIAWIQLEDCGIENFQYELNCAVTQHGTSVPEEFIMKDNIVVAPFGGTTDFYRAKINGTIETNEEPEVSVTFLDYGNSEIVKMSSLLMISEPVMNASCKAVQCILEKIDGKSIAGSNEDNLFCQLVNNTPFYAYITSPEECESSELTGSKTKYVVSLSEEEFHIGESVNQPESLDKNQQKESTSDEANEASRCVEPKQCNIPGKGNFLPKNIITNNLTFEDQNEYILQVINSKENNSDTNANIKETQTHYNTGKEPKPKINSEYKDVIRVEKTESLANADSRDYESLISVEFTKVGPAAKSSKSGQKVHKRYPKYPTIDNVEQKETSANAYSGKWSSLTDTNEYTLNAEGKVVNFNSNESCEQLYNSGSQKSCRKRQMNGNESVSHKDYGNEDSKKNEDLNKSINQAIADKEICSLTENIQKNVINNAEDKSNKLCLQPPDGRKCPIKNSSANSECSTLGSDECFVPVEVLPDVKLHMQEVPIGAEEQIEVMVSHVDSPHSFWLHLVNSETASIDRLNKNLTEHYKNDGDYMKVNRLPVGSFWAVRWRDNCWYRAQILASLPRKSKEELRVNVRFVDIGDSGIVSIKDVRVLADTFTFVPMLALPCSLAQVCPLDEWKEDPWTQKSVEGFVNMIGSSVLKGNFIRYSLNGHFNVVLENEYGVINEMMVERGFAKSSKLQSIIGQQVCPGVIQKEIGNKTDNASAVPINDDFGNKLKTNMKQSSHISSLISKPSQITSGNYEGPVSLNLLKNGIQNAPTLPTNLKNSFLSEKITSVASKKKRSSKKPMPVNINDVKCERGFVRKLCNNYGFIEHFGFQNSLFFHYSEFYGDIDFLDIGDFVEFEICFDEFRCKPMAQNVVKVMSHQEQLVGFVNDEILDGQDENQCIIFMDGERLLYIPLEKADIEGYVHLKPWDQVSFTIKFNQNSGTLTAANISLESIREHNDSASNSDSVFDCQSQDIRWDPLYEAYVNGYNNQTDECVETLISGRQNTDLSRLCKFYRNNGKCPRGVTCRFEHTLLNEAHTVEKEAVFMDLIEEPNLPKEGAVVAMIVTYVESPSMFYCYLPHGVSDLRQGSGRDSGIGLPNSNEGLHDLLRTMSVHYRHSLPTPNRSLPAIGELRAAPLANEDGELEWWRVRILDTTEDHADNLQVKVIFLDYGEVKWVKEMDLRPLDIQFLHMPAQALECWLYDIKRPESDWSKTAKDYFINLTKDRMLVGLISHCDQSQQRLGVKLYDTTENEININDAMMNH